MPESTKQTGGRLKNAPGSTDLAIHENSASRFDPDDFLPMLNGWEMDEAEKIELLHALWSIMCAFVELGFDAKDINKVFLKIFPENIDNTRDMIRFNSAKQQEKESEEHP